MITLQIVNGSLQVSNNGNIILVAPKNSCAIDVLSLYDAIPLVVIYNKYLGNSTNIFTQPLSNCEDSVNVPFTVNSFIVFAEDNLGFNTAGGGGSTPIKLTSQTLTVGTWTLVGIYYTYAFSNVNVDTTSEVSVTPQNSSYLTAYNSQVLPFVEVASGVATFYAQFPPQADMIVDIVITQTT